MAQKNTIQKIISSPVMQTVLIYVSGGWIILEMTDFFIDNYGLNERIRDVLLIVFAAGLPVAIFLTWFLSRDEKTRVKNEEDEASDKRTKGVFIALRSRPWFSIPGIIILLLLLVTGIRYIHRQSKIKWAKEQALERMQNWVHDWDHVSAFELRQEVKKYIPDDPEFKRLDTLITKSYTILTEPEGADIYYKEYHDVEGEWEFLGTTPVFRVEMPNLTMYRWKMVKDDFEDIFAVATTDEDTLYRTMHKVGTIPDGMVYVEDVYRTMHKVGTILDGMEYAEDVSEQMAQDLLSPDRHGFFIDRYEVTNKQFKKFIDQGGYEKSEYWQNEIILNDAMLTFEEAMEHFKDATGRPGPSTWEAGDYPEGQDNYPVNGISWYEAAAYAVYAGKSLPTTNHWRSAAGLEIDLYRHFYGSHILPLSNIGGISLEPVGNNPGLNCFGLYDMAGNVREWCWNESPDGHIIQGGAWNDVSYMSTNTSQLPAFDRSIKNGFRCAIYLIKEQIPDELFLPVEVEMQRDYRSEEPVSELEFQLLKKQFFYDKTDLNSHVEERDDSPADWIIEKISFDAAYENERMIAFLFLPKETVPPYQVLVYFPGSNAVNTRSIFEYRTTSRNLNYLLKNGRAVIYPIYKGTYERRDGSCNPRPTFQSYQYNECLIKWIKDLSRSIDYLETREDIDISRLGFLGDSWGGRLGAMIPAVEDRFKLSILLRGGLSSKIKFPETDEINYVTHVKIPVLMINGKYDFEFTVESTVQPMFDLMSTPEKDKKLVICDTDHFIPTTVMIKEVLDWLDKYFGPVTTAD